MKRTLFALLLLAFSASNLQATQPAEVNEGEANQIATDAYIYFYSLITMETTRAQSTNIEAGKMVGRGPMNTFTNVRTFPPAQFKDVVRPNFDTLYSVAWLDLTKGPLIVSVPNTNGRYYLLPMLDMWSDVFTAPGKRTTGTQAERFLVTPQGWKGTVPKGVTKVEAPTSYVWVIGRTQTNGEADYAAVNKIQDGFTIADISGKIIKNPIVKVNPNIDMKTPPLDQVNNMPAKKYFELAAELMKINPPHITDQSLVARMARIGIVPGKSFSFDKASPVVKSALEKGKTDGYKLMLEKAPTLARVTNGWQMNTDTMGVYGDYYLKRAIIAMLGLGANQPEDAIYPMSVVDGKGKPYTGKNNYILKFAKNQIPPVDAFWSVTLYDEAGFQVANPLNRFAIGDRDQLKYEKDGSLNIYIQNASPGKEKEANWLPAPKGPFNLTMRLYAPKQVALDGRWNPPSVSVY